jgi:5-methylcytosine-specific restriction endonuclease McrA
LTASAFGAPIREIGIAAGYLDDAVSAHLANQSERAKDLILRANQGEIRVALREWTESLWGKASPYNRHREVEGTRTTPGKAQRPPYRVPTAAEKRLLHERDGYHCRFCGIPVIRKEVRDRFRKLYPVEVPWGNSNKEAHAAFQVMWAQYDHIVPRSRGGNNDLDNIVITCAPCNYGRGNYTLEEVWLIDPRTRNPIQSSWDGLERLLHRP